MSHFSRRLGVVLTSPSGSPGPPYDMVDATGAKLSKPLLIGICFLNATRFTRFSLLNSGITWRLKTGCSTAAGSSARHGLPMDIVKIKSHESELESDASSMEHRRQLGEWCGDTSACNCRFSSAGFKRTIESQGSASSKGLIRVSRIQPKCEVTSAAGSSAT